MAEVIAESVERDPHQLTLGRFLAEVVQTHAEREAVVFEGRRLRYRDIERESMRIARGLVGAGVAKGSRIAEVKTDPA